MGSSSATSQPESSAAPAQLRRPTARTGDSGTTTLAATAASPRAIAGIQNSQW
jgi:hypothetical protein